MPQRLDEMPTGQAFLAPYFLSIAEVIAGVPVVKLQGRHSDSGMEQAVVHVGQLAQSDQWFANIACHRYSPHLLRSPLGSLLIVEVNPNSHSAWKCLKLVQHELPVHGPAAILEAHHPVAYPLSVCPAAGGSNEWLPGKELAMARLTRWI